MGTYGIDPHSIWSKVPVSNYDIDATAGGLWTSTTTYRVTAAAGKVTWFWGGYYKGNTANTVVIQMHDAADGILMSLLSEANGSTGFGYPDPALHTCQMPIPMLGGWYIEATAGAAQDSSAYASCVTTEVDAIA